MDALFIIPAASAYFFNDVLVTISLLGSLVRFAAACGITPFERFVPLAEWHIAPLVFGILFQLAFVASGLGAETERMGILVPMPPNLVSMLFALSLGLLGAALWVRRNPPKHV